MQEKGVFTEVHWLQTAKILNKTENSEKNPQSEGKVNPPGPSHLLHSELNMQHTYSIREVRCIQAALKAGCDG